MLRMIINCVIDEDGATLVEYALMLFLIAAACVGAVEVVGSATAAKFDEGAKCFP